MPTIGSLSRGDFPGVLVAIFICELAGFLPALLVGVSGSAEGTQINPPLVPPGPIVPIIWAILYFLMGLAVYVVWRDARHTQIGKLALGLFGVQLVLNATWSLVVFGTTGTYGLGFAMFIPLDIAVAATLVAFWRIDPLRAASPLIPYLVYILFATVLNYWGWQLNL